MNVFHHPSGLFLAEHELAAASPGKPVEFRRRPEPEYDPFVHDDVPKTPHRIEVVEVRSIHGSRLVAYVNTAVPETLMYPVA